MIELLYFNGCPSTAEAETVLLCVLTDEGQALLLRKIAEETPSQAVATGFLK